MTKKIDARGKACPQPVMMTKEAVEKGERDLVIYLDNPVAASNVQRFLSKQGFSMSLRDEEGHIIIEAKAQGTFLLFLPLYKPRTTKQRFDHPNHSGRKRRRT